MSSTDDRFAEAADKTAETTETQAGVAAADDVADFCSQIDDVAGILDQVPAETNVFVVTSVGLKESYPTGGLAEAFCRSLGYQQTPAPGAQRTDLMGLARRIVPESWRVISEMQANNVDLPAPFWPRMPKTSLRSTSNDTSVNASTQRT